jgi:hypothetical protein
LPVVSDYTESVFKRGSLVVTPKPAIGQFIDPTTTGKNLLVELLEELLSGNHGASGEKQMRSIAHRARY